MTDLQKPLPKRSEVPVEMTWDLNPIYTDETKWDADFARVENELPSLSKHKDNLHQIARNVLETLQANDEIGIIFGKLYSYASLKQSQDNGDSNSQNRLEKLRMLGTRLSSATAWIEPELLALEPQKLSEFQTIEDLKIYSYYFETLERRRAHVRSSEVEDVLALAREATSGTATVYKLFNNADLKFPEVQDENGNMVELTHGRFRNFLESRDREVRENSFKVMHGEYDKWRNTLAASLSGAVKTDVFEARVRNYPSALHAALGPDAIPTEVYTNLVSAVHERLPVLHRYLRLRKKMLKLDSLKMWDLYVPMVANVEKEVPYEEAKKILLESSEPLGETYVSILREGLENRWVDVPENEGKSSGAFSDGSYVTPPYILMNWQDNLSNAFTLAHEFGHSAHSYLTRKTQPYVYASYTIFVAEVASTLNEALLTNYLQKQAQASGDKALQLYLLNSYAERFRTTLFRQTMFAEWELQIHTQVENGEALTAENLSASYLELNKTYYGAEVDVDDSVQIEWARIPHFYYGFYVYQYATGISAAAALAQQIVAEGEPAVQRYLEFLRGGSSRTSIDLLRGAGVDMASPAPIHQALDVFDDLIAKMENLAD